jgi:hypothetical protein
MIRSRPWRLRLDPAHFGPREAWLLEAASYSVSSFRYPRGVEAIRVTCGRGEIVWLPFLGQQLWDWKIDGRSRKFTGFVQTPAPGRTYLQNYGAFLIHCGVTAMGNPGPGDTHPLHGELPTAVFDRVWLEILAAGSGSLALCGSLHWHVPYEVNYRCLLRTTIDPAGTSVSVEVTLRNESELPLEAMYLAHINFALAGAAFVRCAEKHADGAIRIRDESANPGARPQLVVGTLHLAGLRADPEFVATIGRGPVPARETESRLVLEDGSSFWVRPQSPLLDHHVIWISSTPDRGACGFHLPSTAAPDGLAAARAAGDLKLIPPRGTSKMTYSFGYNDAEQTGKEQRDG